MKRIEITLRSYTTELEKLYARLEKAEKAYQKKLAQAEKFGVATMTDEEHFEWLKTVPTCNGWITDKAAIKKNGAWFDLISAKRNISDIQRSIEHAERRFEKDEQAVEEYRREIEAITDLKEKEKLFKLEFEKEQAEWLKDGIKLEGRYYGITPSGKKFWISRNNGFTERSFHCWTLYLDGETIFTSGEFWRAYGIIKQS